MVEKQWIPNIKSLEWPLAYYYNSPRWLGKPRSEELSMQTRISAFSQFFFSHKIILLSLPLICCFSGVFRFSSNNLCWIWINEWAISVKLGLFFGSICNNGKGVISYLHFGLTILLFFLILTYVYIPSIHIHLNQKQIRMSSQEHSNIVQ